MNVTEKWTTSLKNPIYRGLAPIIDPFEPSFFYVGDGWGSTHASMKLRKFSLETGKEIVAISIKNNVRCLYFNPNTNEKFVVSDNKIFQVDRSRFSIVKKYASGIQKYNDYISSNDKDTLLLMNWNSDFLFVYNYLLEKATKKNLKSCRGIHSVTGSSFLIFSANNGAVISYDLEKNATAEVLRPGVYASMVTSSSGALYFHAGQIKPATETMPEMVEPLPELKIYSSLADPEPVTIRFDFAFESFRVSENEEVVYLMYKATVWAYSLKNKSLISMLSFDPAVGIAQLFEKEKLILTHSLNYTEEKNLTCWRFHL